MHDMAEHLTAVASRSHTTVGMAASKAGKAASNGTSGNNNGMLRSLCVLKPRFLRAGWRDVFPFGEASIEG